MATAATTGSLMSGTGGLAMGAAPLFSGAAPFLGPAGLALAIAGLGMGLYGQAQAKKKARKAAKQQQLNDAFANLQSAVSGGGPVPISTGVSQDPGADYAGALTQLGGMAAGYGGQMNQQIANQRQEAYQRATVAAQAGVVPQGADEGLTALANSVKATSARESAKAETDAMYKNAQIANMAAAQKAKQDEIAALKEATGQKRGSDLNELAAKAALAREGFESAEKIAGMKQNSVVDTMRRIDSEIASFAPFDTPEAKQRIKDLTKLKDQLLRQALISVVPGMGSGPQISGPGGSPLTLPGVLGSNPLQAY